MYHLEAKKEEEKSESSENESSDSQSKQRDDSKNSVSSDSEGEGDDDMLFCELFGCEVGDKDFLELVQNHHVTKPMMILLLNYIINENTLKGVTTTKQQPHAQRCAKLMAHAALPPFANPESAKEEVLSELFPRCESSMQHPLR